MTIGGGWSKYDGLHFGTLPYLSNELAPKHYKYYDNDAVKSENNLYTKWDRKLMKKRKVLLICKLETYSTQ